MIAFVYSLPAFAQMEFVQNKGQWHEAVQYRADFKTGTFFLEKKGFTVTLYDTSDLKKLGDLVHGHGINEKTNPGNQPFDFNYYVYKVNFLGASPSAQQIPGRMVPGYNNYFIGNDPSKWASDCKIYQAITYKNIYPNIDLRYYTQDDKLKYDFIVHPGGNVASIALNYIGATKLAIQQKNLIITTPVGMVTELSPYTYQATSGKKQEISSRYVLKDNVVSFQVDNYDRSATLVIDPSVIFSSFTGSTIDTWGYTATPGPDGSFFAAGIAFGTGFKVSPGAYQQTYQGGIPEAGFGGYDVSIFKFSANGSNRLYATYLGGSGNEQPHSMICDPQGNLVVAGRTNSQQFPNNRGVSNAGGYDIFVTKFNAAGTGIIGSYLIGGPANDGVNIEPKYPLIGTGAKSLRRNYGDDARSEVILDASNNIYLASSTQSDNFPVTAAIQGARAGAQDGVIIKFTPNLGSVLFSTYFGGSEDDACFVMAIDPVSTNLYVAGATASANIPGDKSGTIGPQQNGTSIDGFVTILRSDGSAILKTSYFGTGQVDLVYGLKFDRKGFPYIMGTSTGSWPVINAPFSQPGSKQFISKLKPDLSAYEYSTVFGTNIPSPNISPVAFLVDRCENVYVSGWGGGINNQQFYSSGTTNGLTNVNPLPGIPAPDGADFYFFVMEKNAGSQLFGSHFGQNGGLGDHVDGGTSRFDENGVIYQAICTNCEGGSSSLKFPTTPGSWSPSNASAGCNYASVKIEMNFAGVSASVQASINGIKADTTGCIDLLVNFQDTLAKGKKYYWNFGDGSPTQITTTATNSHLFTSVGTFRVMLISEDSATCNIRDTAYLNIRAGNNKGTLGFTFSKVPPCESLTMQFVNTSVPTTNNFGPKSFIWDYGDGSPRDTAGLTPPRIHTYASPGTYFVKLILIDTSFCNAPDTLEQEIRLNPLVKAMFTAPTLGCAPFEAEFINTSLAGTDFLWDFGDGNTSTASSPTHVYSAPGTYRVRLIANDPSTCNLTDTSAFHTITVVSKPTARFTWSPNPPIENRPVQFTNLSTGATRYLWNFGDGESSTETNPIHQYNKTGTYDAELIAYNEANCTDTFRLPVDVIIVPVLDVPNAFTPGRFGTNAVVTVKGFGIGKMLWRIYNRWGQLMFETTSLKFGWDGTFKGKLQPQDVYAYTLDVEFTDGTKTRKTGDITLIR